MHRYINSIFWYMLMMLPGSLEFRKNLIRCAHQSVLQECGLIMRSCVRKYKYEDFVRLYVELWRLRFGVEMPDNKVWNIKRRTNE